MLYDCDNKESIDLSSFDTKNITNARDIPNDCSIKTNRRQKLFWRKL